VELTLPATAGELSAGQRLRLVVRQKPQKRPAGPAEFDAAAWMLANHIVARLSSARGANPQLLGTPSFSMDQLRQQFGRYLRQRPREASLSGLDPLAVVLALVTGDRSQLEDQHWALFNRTGTSHLIAISGLHVGLVVLIVMQLSFLLLRRWTWLTQRIPASHCALTVGWLGALFYAALAGFSLPTQRALLMVTVLAMTTVLGRARQLWFALLLAFCLVLLWDPLACRSLGFWLSFVAVFLILWMIGAEVTPRTSLQRWSAIQFGLFLGLGPILLWSVHSVSLVSPFANLVAIPVVGFVVVPLSLLWAILWLLVGDGALFLLHGAAFVMDGLMWFLQQIASWRYSVWQVGVRDTLSLLLALVGVLWLASPGLPGRFWGAILLLPMLLPQTQGLGLYVMAADSGRLVLQTERTVVSIARSHWPQPLADWQLSLLENWGVAVPAKLEFHNTRSLWLAEGAVLSRYSMEQDVLGGRSLKLAEYGSLCGPPLLQTDREDDREYRIWSLSRTQCVVELHWDQQRWLYWPLSGASRQQAMLELLTGEKFDGLVIDLGQHSALLGGVLQLIRPGGTLVTVKPLQDSALPSIADSGVQLHSLTEDGYLFVPIATESANKQR